DMPKPPAWMTNTKLGMFRVGLNITEPLPNNYYPEPTEHTGAAGTEDFYDDPAGAIGGYLDQPLDSVSGRPLQRHDMLRTATYENVSSVFLQRLADPTQMYNAVTNPYLTVDWATID